MMKPFELKKIIDVDDNDIDIEVDDGHLCIKMNLWWKLHVNRMKIGFEP